MGRGIFLIFYKKSAEKPCTKCAQMRGYVLEYADNLYEYEMR